MHSLVPFPWPAWPLAAENGKMISEGDPGIPLLGHPQLVPSDPETVRPRTIAHGGRGQFGSTGRHIRCNRETGETKGLYFLILEGGWVVCGHGSEVPHCAGEDL